MFDKMYILEVEVHQKLFGVNLMFTRSYFTEEEFQHLLPWTADISGNCGIK